LGGSIVAATASLIMTHKSPKLGFIFSVSSCTAWAYYCLTREESKLVFCSSSEFNSAPASSLCSRIARILALTPSLFSPAYLPPVWAADRWSNLCLFSLKQVYDKSRLRDNSYTRKALSMPDGGTLYIDFLDSNLSPTAPIVVFLHTVTGSAKETGHYMRAAFRRGWRSCVFLRRGHDSRKLSSPYFNLMGEGSDTRHQLEYLTTSFPHRQFLGMVGVSAGSGLLITYLGMEGDSTPVDAACALCPAYDLRRAFRVAQENPSIDRHILNSVKRLFMAQNEELLSAHSLLGFINCSNSSTVAEFIEAHVPFTGCSDLEDYYAQHNPVGWMTRVRRPLLIVNSEDDVACLAENIREDIVRSQPGVLLLRTPRGSHISFNEGVLGTGCYLSRISMDFLESALRTC